MWTESAQAKTRACAEKAGMGKGDRLQIVSEPEAAAVYALDAIDPHDIKVGDTFVLCDAGGGKNDHFTRPPSRILQLTDLLLRHR